MPLRSDEIHIESERLSIRPFSADDADAAFRCITPSLTRFMSWEPPANREVFDRIWQGWLATIAEGTNFTFAIRQRADESFLGLTGLHNVRDACAELGIWIREDFHAQGFGREAAGLVAMWASLVLGTESFTYPVAEENYPSRRIAESLGGVVVARRETSKYMSVIYRIPKQSTYNE
ncbi:GNAT family N-acetyltransferase [Paraburkholderia fungorum]|uniref:GNAT family N-acetyltransferase n=1 Tax=Paraburkholderia fungorum TaxID=134537 RepID=UPI0038BD1F96